MREIVRPNAIQLGLIVADDPHGDYFEHRLRECRLAGMKVPDERVVISVAGGQGESSEEMLVSTRVR
jgi:hypothetical protein